METLQYLSMTELEAGLEHIRQAPRDQGVLQLIVRRPNVDEREIVNTAQINTEVGLVGDTWTQRSSRHTPDKSPSLNSQITLMNTRAIALFAQTEDRWSLAGDQLYADMDIGQDNLPAGSRIAIGSVILEVSTQPHTGCAKFSARFGTDALKFVNSPDGTQLRLRGVNMRVIQSGEIKAGDVLKKI
jgi:MOSC domain-containing protein